jgi:hypothetical protein
MNSVTASCASSSIVVDSKNARSFSGSDGIVRTLPWSADDTFGDAGTPLPVSRDLGRRRRVGEPISYRCPNPSGSRRGCQGEGPGRGVPCFRAHDETVAIAYRVAARPIALVDELRVSTRRAERPG